MVISTIAGLAGRGAIEAANTPVIGTVETTVKKLKNTTVTTVDSRSLRVWEIAIGAAVIGTILYIPEVLHFWKPDVEFDNPIFSGGIGLFNLFQAAEGQDLALPSFPQLPIFGRDDDLRLITKGLPPESDLEMRKIAKDLASDGIVP